MTLLKFAPPSSTSVRTPALSNLRKRSQIGQPASKAPSRRMARKGLQLDHLRDLIGWNFDKAYGTHDKYYNAKTVYRNLRAGDLII